MLYRVKLYYGGHLHILVFMESSKRSERVQLKYVVLLCPLTQYKSNLQQGIASRGRRPSLRPREAMR